MLPTQDQACIDLVSRWEQNSFQFGEICLPFLGLWNIRWSFGSFRLVFNNLNENHWCFKKSLTWKSSKVCCSQNQMINLNQEIGQMKQLFGRYKYNVLTDSFEFQRAQSILFVRELHDVCFKVSCLLWKPIEYILYDQLWSKPSSLDGRNRRIQHYFWSRLGFSSWKFQQLRLSRA